MLGDASFKFLLQIFGYAYPGYLCFKDVEKRDDGGKLRLWCMYWVLMAAFSAIQPVADTFLFFIPLYYSAKLAFAVYLWANNLAGAELVYSRYVQPFVTRHEPVVDGKIAEVRAVVTEIVSSNFARGVQWLQAKMVEALAKANQVAAGTMRAEPAGEAAPAAGFKAPDFKTAGFKGSDTLKTATDSIRSASDSFISAVGGLSSRSLSGITNGDKEQ